MIEELDEKFVADYVDERGQVRDFRALQVEGLHVATVEPGAARGGHVHDRDEILCVAGGRGICEIMVSDGVSGAADAIVVSGDVKAYRIRAGVKHVVRNTGSQRFYLVCFYEASSKSPGKPESA